MPKESFYNQEELSLLGLKKYGTNVKISRKASIHSPGKIELGDHVRIDDFCFLSGEIKFGSYIHISAYVAFYGKYGIELEDFSGLSPRVIVFSTDDDFSGEHMIGPMVPNEYIKLKTGKVQICKFVQVGAGSIVMPDVTLHEGAIAGAMSLVKKDLDPWSVYCGVPAKYLKERSKKNLNYYEEMKQKLGID
jgi:galactoside O-acetyltransferase